MTRTKKIKNVLFLCTGNICRSPFAEKLMNKMAIQNGISDAVADSAGLLALPGNNVTELAKRVAGEFDVDLTSHRAKTVSSRLVDWSDLVLVMEKSHERALVEAFPRTTGKVLLLRHFGRHGSRKRGIADPYGLQYDAYRFCYLDIEDAVSGLIAYLSAKGLSFENVQVTCYEGYRANESPRYFMWRNRKHVISDIVDRWYESGLYDASDTSDYFKVKTMEGKIFILRYNRLFDRWGIMVQQS